MTYSTGSFNCTCNADIRQFDPMPICTAILFCTNSGAPIHTNLCRLHLSAPLPLVRFDGPDCDSLLLSTRFHCGSPWFTQIHCGSPGFALLTLIHPESTWFTPIFPVHSDPPLAITTNLMNTADQLSANAGCSVLLWLRSVSLRFTPFPSVFAPFCALLLRFSPFCFILLG